MRDDETLAVCGLVVRTTFERWPAIKRAMEIEGGEILFQKAAPRGTFLRILDDGPIRVRFVGRTPQVRPTPVRPHPGGRIGETTS
jgi:hypothetical protein